MATVLITGVGGGVAQSVLRSLRLSGLNLRIIGTDMSPNAVGFYSLDKGYVTSPHTDTSYIGSLLDISLNEEVDMVIPGLDPEVVLLSQVKDQFIEHNIKVVTGSLQSVSICRNKFETYKFFHSKSMPFAQTFTSEALLQNPYQVEYPIFVKPFDGSASRGSDVVFTPDALVHTLKENPNLIVQEFLLPEKWNLEKKQLTPKDTRRGDLLRQEEELGAVTYVSSKGELLGSFLCIFELCNGVLQNAMPYFDREINRIVEDMVQELIKIGMVGPVSLQGRITKDGPVFYEINPRFTGGAAMSAGFGFNHCRAAVEDFVLGYSTTEIREKINVNYNLICKRYITEMIIEKGVYQKLKTDGSAGPSNGKTLVL